MKLPDKVTIAGLRYEISTDADELARTGQKERANLQGHCDRQKQRILLSTEMHDQSVAETIVHEVLHAITQIVGLADEWDTDTEESVVNRLAPPLAQTIANNPKLTAAIQEAWT